MAGNENSGRRKIYEEWNKVSAINKLWEKVNRKVMANEELTEFEEKLVASILPKTIKTETDITTGGEALPVLVKFLDGNSNNNTTGVSTPIQ